MRYRKIDANGDMVFGHGTADYFINNSAAVGQAVETTLRLIQGEWFLDITAGVPYYTQVLGYDTQSLYDALIRAIILSVQGVTSIVSYNSILNPVNRTLTITVTVQTQFSQQVTVTVTT